MPANVSLRENHKRAVYVTGLFDVELLQRVTPLIQDFRFSENAPITIYINSDGGDPDIADALSNLTKAPTQDKKRCQLVTVVHSRSGSAATELLIKGDYAIAYPEALIHYHGVQRLLKGQYSEGELLEQSRRAKLANEDFALRLASTIFPRVVRLIVFEFELTDASDMEAIAHSMTALLSKEYSQIVSSSASTVNRLWNVLNGVTFDGKAEWRKNEIDLLHQIVDLEYTNKENAYENLPDLSNGGIEIIAEEFRLFLDAFVGDNDSIVEKMSTKFGYLFLNGDERKQFDEIPDNESEKQDDFLLKVVKSRLRKIFYFILTYCRKLQTNEFVFNPSEAYALGLIDEVCGRHSSWRDYTERPKKQNPTDQPQIQN